MVGKRAKILAQAHVEDLLVFAQQTRHPIRNQVLVLLSVKAGLRAGEIANLSWDMVVLSENHQPSQDRNGDNGARSLDCSVQGRIFL